jgi:signal transduction histidine kinase
VLLLQRSERLDREKAQRREAINRAMLRAEETGPQHAMCQQLHEQYNAHRVFFYVPRDEKFECAASHPNGKEPSDKLVEDVSRDLQPTFETIKPNESDRCNPLRAASHGLISRACIPLSIKGLLGVIDIRWSEEVKRSKHILRHGFEELNIITPMIASIYQRHLLRADLKVAETRANDLAARSTYKADAMIAPATQALHRCNNVDALLELLENMIEAGTDKDKIISRIHEIRLKTRQLPRAMRFLKAGTEPRRKEEDLTTLVNDAVSEFDWDDDVKCMVSVPPRLIVNVNSAWIVEAFFNIIDNGIRAVYDKGQPGIVTISATAAGEMVRIVFKDTGVGMTDEEVKMVFEGGSQPKPQRTGVGVPLTRMLLVEQGGEIDITSQKGFGTEVVVVLPLMTRSMDHEPVNR